MYTNNHYTVHCGANTLEQRHGHLPIQNPFSLLLAMALIFPSQLQYIPSLREWTMWLGPKPSSTLHSPDHSYWFSRWYKHSKSQNFARNGETKTLLFSSGRQVRLELKQTSCNHEGKRALWKLKTGRDHCKPWAVGWDGTWTRPWKQVWLFMLPSNFLF